MWIPNEARRQKLEEVFEITAKPIRYCNMKHENGDREKTAEGKLIQILDETSLRTEIDFVAQCDEKTFGCVHANFWSVALPIMTSLKNWAYEDPSLIFLYERMAITGEKLKELDEKIRFARVGSPDSKRPNRAEAIRAAKPLEEEHRRILERIDPLRIELHFVLARALCKEPLLSTDEKEPLSLAHE